MDRDPAEVRRLLAQGADPGFRDGEGRTALYLALESRCLPCMEALAPVSRVAAQDRFGVSSLKKAGSGQVDALFMLLPYADAAAVRHYGPQAIIWAARSGNASGVRDLLDRGVSPDAFWEGEGTGMTSLHWVVVQRHFEVAKVLLSRGADPTIRSKSKWAPLDSAVRERDADMTALLIGPHFTTLCLQFLTGRYNLDSVALPGS